MSKRGRKPLGESRTVMLKVRLPADTRTALLREARVMEFKSIAALVRFLIDRLLNS